MVEHDQHVLARVHPVLADRRARVRGEVLEAGRVRRRGGDDRRVVHRPRVLEGLTYLGDRRALLADGHVDASDLALRIAGRPVLPLVDDRVDGDRGLARLPVTDDQLARAPADRRHRVDRLDARLQRLLHRLAVHHTWCLHLEPPQLGAADLALAVQRVAERVHDPAEEAVPDRNGKDLAGAADALPLVDLAEVAEDDDADLAHVQVERETARAVLEFEQFGGHGRGQPFDPGDAVAALRDRAHLLARGSVRLVLLNEALERAADILRPDRQLRHLFPLSWSVSRDRIYAE